MFPWISRLACSSSACVQCFSLSCAFDFAGGGSAGFFASALELAVVSRASAGWEVTDSGVLVFSALAGPREASAASALQLAESRLPAASTKARIQSLLEQVWRCMKFLEPGWSVDPTRRPGSTALALSLIAGVSRRVDKLRR